MTAERRFITILENDPDPALQAARVAYGYIEQDDEKEPTALPFIVVNRTGSEFIQTTCSTQLSAYFVDISVTLVARTLEQVRQLSQAARFALVLSPEYASLELEADDYDSDLRAWVAVQAYRVFDHSPNL